MIFRNRMEIKAIISKVRLTLVIYMKCSDKLLLCIIQADMACCKPLDYLDDANFVIFTISNFKEPGSIFYG